MLKYILVIAFICITVIGCKFQSSKEDKLTTVKNTTQPKGDPGKMETATLAGGCFWCIETIFNDLKGVDKVVSGYSGGKVKDPSYEQVCTGTTGHAEVVQITFDPSVISYETLLDVFFHIHNPTTLNKQGADVGTQYRSAIFYHSEEQKKTAESEIDKINKSGLWDAPIVTEVTPFDEFYDAEAYHQDYYNQNKEKSYCSIVIAPKVNKFFKEYKHLLKENVQE